MRKTRDGCAMRTGSPLLESLLHSGSAFRKIGELVQHLSLGLVRFDSDWTTVWDSRFESLVLGHIHAVTIGIWCLSLLLGKG